MLQVVENENTDLKYEAQLLSTKELIDKYWGQCTPLLQRCIEKAMHGEMLVEDLYTRALKGEVFVIVAKNDDTEVPTVKLVILELVYILVYSYEFVHRWKRVENYDTNVLERCLWLG